MRKIIILLVFIFGISCSMAKAETYNLNFSVSIPANVIPKDCHRKHNDSNINDLKSQNEAQEEVDAQMIYSSSGSRGYRDTEF